MTRLSCVVLLTGWLLRQVEPLAPSQQNNATRAAISSLAASLSPATVVASSACASEFVAPTPPPADAQQVRRRPLLEQGMDETAQCQLQA